MKALNGYLIVKKYLIFLGYFSTLLAITLLYSYFYFKTFESYSIELERRQQESDYVNNGKIILSHKIDSLNNFIKLLNTKQVQNETALERSIINLKNGAVRTITDLEKVDDYDFKLQKTIIYNVEAALEIKRNLSQAKSEEENSRKKLFECIEANKKMKEEYEK